MTAPADMQGLILAVHPHRQGLGWVLFEGPLAPADWGIVRPGKDKNARCFAKVERLIARYEPDVVVLEQFERRPARRTARIKDLCAAILHLAATRGIETRVYSRTVIRTCFSHLGARTRYEIAKTIAVHIDVFRHRLPPPRKPWQAEDCRQSLFDAAALALTHFAVRGDHPLAP